MSSPAPRTALCAALPIPAADGRAPEWIHLLPAGEIRTVDDRGPYRVADADAVIRASIHGDIRLPLDENHAADYAAPRGDPSPARGWITALESRQDGIWGRVDWTAHGRRLVAGRAYRHISPAIVHRQDGTVVGIARASLVNRPNLIGLTALHQQDDRTMDFLAKLRAELGLKDDADEAAVMDAVKRARASVSTHGAQLSAQLAPIAKVAGLKEDADGAAVLQAVQGLADPAKRVPADAVTALQGQVTTLQTELTTLRQSNAKERAEAAVDAAIKAGKVAAPASMRDHYVARHMVDPAAVDKEFAAMPSLHGRGIPSGDPPKDGPAHLDQGDARVVALMGLDPGAFQKTRAAEGAREGVL